MALFSTHLDVRVTAPERVRTPFIAPELSPPSTVALELDKGKPGWTRRDVKLPALPGDGNPSYLADQREKQLTVGKIYLIKGKSSRTVAHPRPTTRRWS